MVLRGLALGLPLDNFSIKFIVLLIGAQCEAYPIVLPFHLHQFCPVCIPVAYLVMHRSIYFNLKLVFMTMDAPNAKISQFLDISASNH